MVPVSVLFMIAEHLTVGMNQSLRWSTLDGLARLFPCCFSHASTSLSVHSSHSVFLCCWVSCQRHGQRSPWVLPPCHQYIPTESIILSVTPWKSKKFMKLIRYIELLVVHFYSCNNYKLLLCVSLPCTGRNCSVAISSWQWGAWEV